MRAMERCGGAVAHMRALCLNIESRASDVYATGDNKAKSAVSFNVLARWVDACALGFSHRALLLDVPESYGHIT